MDIIQQLLLVADVHGDEEEGEESSISLLCIRAVGEIRRLREENERLRKDAATKAMRMLQAEYKEMAQQVAELRLDLRRYQEREATMGWNQS